MSESLKPQLDFDKETMREMGYRTIDTIVDHLSNLHRKSATECKPWSDLDPSLREPPPKSPTDYQTVLDFTVKEILGPVMWCNHPRHYAWVPGPSNYVGALADALCSGFNIAVDTWLEAAGPTQIEMTTIEWLRQWCGLPEGASGIFVSGGSVANLTAIATARRIKLNDEITDAVIYCSDQLHSSVLRNLRILGFRKDQVRKLPSDSALRLSIPSLEDFYKADVEAGKKPFCVIATAGTTNAGAVDPLPDIHRFCRERNLWFHIDGAYGAAAHLTNQGKDLLQGLGSADSIAIDPHKWLFQPFEIGCCLVREPNWLDVTFSERPEYLQDTWDDSDNRRQVNFGERGVQLTRGFRALKLWMTIKVFGETSLKAAIDHGINSATYTESLLRNSGCFEIVTPAQLGIVTFRYITKHHANPDQLTKAIYDANRKDGHSMLTTTLIQGSNVLRMCTINPRTTQEDLETTVEKLMELGQYADISLATNVQ